jgi:large subunit ribosomal protein L24
MKLKIKKGDLVTVISGSDKGKSGKVLKVSPKDLKVLVEGVNLRKKHVKPSQKTPQGGVITQERPIHYSKVMLLDGQGKPTRIGISVVKGKDGKLTRTRVAKTTKQPVAETAVAGKK